MTRLSDAQASFLENHFGVQISAVSQTPADTKSDDNLTTTKKKFAILMPRARKVLDTRAPAKRPVGGLLNATEKAIESGDTGEAARLTNLLEEQLTIWEARDDGPSAEDLVSPDILASFSNVKPAEVEVAQAEYDHAKAEISRMPDNIKKAANDFNKRFTRLKTSVDQLLAQLDSGALDPDVKTTKLAELEKHREQILELVSTAQEALKKGVSL